MYQGRPGVPREDRCTRGDELKVEEGGRAMVYTGEWLK